MRAAGKTEGIAVFKPPRTDPIKPRVVVPDDFELPEGYIRRPDMAPPGMPIRILEMPKNPYGSGAR